ncbi:hypothetical protein C8R43DRAFT_1035371 [Mycena crocata]|nr:hypothetical protein C8R43DRAFT_1035371 [Mycena crocata]
MLSLPNELLVLIAAHLNRNELWVLIRVSSRLRSIALLPFLTQYNVPETQIRSGKIRLSEEAYFLIIVISNTHAIRRLEVSTGKVSLRALQSILALVPHIPDIVVHNNRGLFKNTRGVAGIISAASKFPRRRLVLVSRGTVSVSRPRRIRPIRWGWIPDPTWLTATSFTFRNLLADAVFLVPLSLSYLSAGIINSGVLVAWLLPSVAGPHWEEPDRIAHDLGWVQCQWMRIQTMGSESSDRFTLVTFGGSSCSPLVLRPLPALTESQTSTVWATLDLSEHLKALTITEGCNASLSDFLHCVHCHPELTRLVVQPNSVSSSSLRDMIHLPSSAHLTDVCGPAYDIPRLLRAAPNVRDISIFFPAARGERVETDLTACNAALDAIARLPGTHPIALTLHLRKTTFNARAVPWHVRTFSQPPPRINHLSIRIEGASGASVEIKLLARWLKGLFSVHN